MSHLPDYRDRFLQGVSDKTKLGDRLEAGIPNLTGDFTHIGGHNNYVNYPKRGNAVILQPSLAATGYTFNPQNRLYNYIFNASYASKVYKDDVNTVQPPSVIVKYIIKAE